MALGISAETLINAYDGRTDGEKVKICVLVANQLHIGMPWFKGILEAKIIHRIQDARYQERWWKSCRCWFWVPKGDFSLPGPLWWRLLLLLQLVVVAYCPRLPFLAWPGSHYNVKHSSSPLFLLADFLSILNNGINFFIKPADNGHRSNVDCVNWSINKKTNKHNNGIPSNS